jgi:putative transcriptional regulator
LPFHGAEASVVRSGFCLRRNLVGVLAALLGVFAGGSPALADDTKLTTILIVARAELPDAHFADSVVLVMNNLAVGPVGIIINKPTKIPISEIFPDWKRLRLLHDKLYFGGPVDLDTVWFLFRSKTTPEHAIQACDGVYLSADRDLLRKLLGRDKPMEGLKIFVGHSGWAPGQLEGEIDHGDWSAKPADADAIFKGQTEHPWPPPEAEEGHSA